MILENNTNTPIHIISSNERTDKAITPTTSKKYIDVINYLLDLPPIEERNIKHLETFLNKGSAHFSYEDKNRACYYNPIHKQKQELLQRKNLELLSNSIIPDSWEDAIKTYNVEITDSEGNKYDDYDEIIHKKFRMFGLVDNTWVSELADELDKRKIKSCLEVGGGYGWLSLALSKYFNVTCTDKNPQKREGEVSATISGFPVEKMDVSFATKNYGASHDAVVVSWPHYQDDWIENLEQGKIIVYIGESPFDSQMAGIDFFKYFNMEKCIYVPGGSELGCIIGTKTDTPTEQYDMDTLHTKKKVKQALKLPTNWI